MSAHIPHAPLPRTDFGLAAAVFLTPAYNRFTAARSRPTRWPGPTVASAIGN